MRRHGHRPDATRSLKCEAKVGRDRRESTQPNALPGHAWRFCNPFLTSPAGGAVGRRASNVLEQLLRRRGLLGALLERSSHIDVGVDTNLMRGSALWSGGHMVCHHDQHFPGQGSLNCKQLELQQEQTSRPGNAARGPDRGLKVARRQPCVGLVTTVGRTPSTSH